MSHWRGRRPPRRICPSCGGEHYAFGEGTACSRCMAGSADDAAALREIVRERREARRAALEAPRDI